MNEPLISVIILTFNEARHLQRALDSLAGLNAKVFVVDSQSTDATPAIARANGAVLVQNPFVNQAQQFNWALDVLPLATPWVLRLDADEVLAPDLITALNQTLPTLPPEVAGVALERRQIFMNRPIRWGGRARLNLLRVFRTGRGRAEERWMDEQLVVTKGKTVTIKGGFFDHSLLDLAQFIDKHNRYATREAVQVLCERHGLLPAPPTGMLSPATRLRRLLKARLYHALPYPLASAAYFVWRYGVRLGFLDGEAGLVYHGLQGFWYRFLVGARTRELARAIAHFDTAEAIGAELARRTGLPVHPASLHQPLPARKAEMAAASSA